MAEKKLKIKITTEGAQKSAQQASGLTSAYKKAAGSIAAMGSAYLIATKAAKFFNDSIKLAVKQEFIYNRLRTAVELTGKSFDDLRPSLMKTFIALQQVTEFGDTQSADVLMKLMQFTGDYDKALGSLPITLDLVASGMMDMNMAARLVAAASQGNISMLGRYIAELKSSVTPQIAQMDAAERAAFAMQVLNDKFGGTAINKMNAYAGKVAQLKNYFGDLQEAIGDRFIPVLSTATLAATSFIKSLTENDLQSTIAELERYGVSVEKIQELEKLGVQLDLIEVESQLKKINTEGKTREELEQGIVDRIKERAAIAKKLADETIAKQAIINELAKDENQIKLGMNQNDANRISGLKGQLAWANSGVISLEKQAEAQNKLIEGDKEIINLLADAAKFEGQLAILSNDQTIDITADVKAITFSADVELPDLGDMSLEFDAGSFEEDQEKMIAATVKALIKMFELQEQFDDGGKDRLQIQQEAEIEKWKEYYDTLIDLDGSFEAKKTEIDSKYAGIREKISIREFAREAKQVGRLVGALGDLAEATGANAESLKVIKSGEAIINTYAGAARALADYPAPASFVVAASVIASGIANVAKINATGFQFGTGDEGFKVPSGNPRDSFLFAAQSGENVTVTPAGKPSSSSNTELLAEVKLLRTAIASQPKYIIRTIDKFEMSEIVEDGNYARSRT